MARPALEDMRTDLIITGAVRDVASSRRVPGGRMIVTPVPGSAACGAAAERPAEVARLPRRDQGREFRGRPRSGSARADWAASRARAASCPALLARASAAATRSSAAACPGRRAGCAVCQHGGMLRVLRLCSVFEPRDLTPTWVAYDPIGGCRTMSPS